MAMIIRYFDPAGAGTADGTSWANRAALFPGGAWSNVIKDFDFSGSDGLLCYCNGSFTGSTVELSSTVGAPHFTVAIPTWANPLIMVGCDNTGTLISPLEPGWMSCEPPFDDTNFPVITTGTNNVNCTVQSMAWRCFKFVNNHHGLPHIRSVGPMDWTVSTASVAWSQTDCYEWMTSPITNAYAAVTATEWRCVVVQDERTLRHNIRMQGNAGTSGVRAGVSSDSADASWLTDCTIRGVPGLGVQTNDAQAGHAYRVLGCVIVECGDDGLQFGVTGNTEGSVIDRCTITGNGGWGLDNNTGERTMLVNNRFRDNTSGNITNMGNYPSDWDNYTTDTTDALEYVNAASGDYTVLETAAIWPYDFGVAREVPESLPGGGGLLTHPGMAGGMRG